jgi:hypothetical protein
MLAATALIDPLFLGMWAEYNCSGAWQKLKRPGTGVFDFTCISNSFYSSVAKDAG